VNSRQADSPGTSRWPRKSWCDTRSSLLIGERAMRPCTACGKPNLDQARFCGHCGRRFPFSSEETRVAQRPNDQDTSLSSPQPQSHDQGLRPTSHQQRRHCPRCTFPLQVTRYRGEELDHCHRCGGTFLDPGEERRILGAAASPSVWKEASVTRVLGPSQLTCPADQSTFVARTVEFADQTVEVDLCPQCAGIWLDAKECQTLR
jgi:Zn-finger nucleic acid-binding protein